MRKILEEEANKLDFNMNMVRVGPYLGMLKKTEYTCSYCNKIWMVTPKTIWKGAKGHSSCYHKIIRQKYCNHYEMNGSYYNRIINSAKQRNIEFNVSIEYLYGIYIIQNKKCNLSGLDIKICNPHDKNDNSASLDRIDNTKGYLVGNVQWLHKDYNRFKLDLKQKKLIEMCHTVSEYQKSKTESL